MERTDLMDTSEWAHREMVRLLRSLSPAERLKIVIDRVNLGREVFFSASLRIAESKENSYGSGSATPR